MSKIETLFLITVNEDGTLTSFGELPKELPEVKRPANNFDVYQAAKQIVDEFEQNILANRIAQVVIGALKPAETPMSDRIKDKLKERGIEPESPATND